MIKVDIFKEFKNYKIFHTKTGLFFNGYENHNSVLSKGKNTLSLNNSKNIFTTNKNLKEILENAFDGNIIVKEDGQKYIKNVIVYAGSEIHQLLSNHYEHYEYLPLKDFSIKSI